MIRLGRWYFQPETGQRDYDLVNEVFVEEDDISTMKTLKMLMIFPLQALKRRLMIFWTRNRATRSRTPTLPRMLLTCQCLLMLPHTIDLTNVTKMDREVRMQRKYFWRCSLTRIECAHLQLEKYEVVEDCRVIRHMSFEKIHPRYFYTFQLGIGVSNKLVQKNQNFFSGVFPRKDFGDPPPLKNRQNSPGPVRAPRNKNNRYPLQMLAVKAIRKASLSWYGWE